MLGHRPQGGQLRGSWRAWLPRFLVLVERLPHLNLVHPADRAIGFAIVELEDGELGVSADVEGCSIFTRDLSNPRAAKSSCRTLPTSSA